MILNDAVQFVENIGQTAYGAQKETNLHYMQELNRKIKLMSDEVKHVADADEASVLLMRTPEQEAKDKIAADKAAKDQAQAAKDEEER